MFSSLSRRQRGAAGLRRPGSARSLRVTDFKRPRPLQVAAALALPPPDTLLERWRSIWMCSRLTWLRSMLNTLYMEASVSPSQPLLSTLPSIRTRYREWQPGSLV